MSSERRIFINATVCVVGGGVQVAAGFVRHACAVASARGWRLSVALSSAVAAECLESEVLAESWWVASRSPGSPLGGREIRRELMRRVDEFGAEIVFTVFGPSYMRFQVPELMGFADGFVMNPLHGCYDNHPWLDALKGRLNSFIKRFALAYADEFWVETRTARSGLARVAGISPERIHVVSNGVNRALADALSMRPPSASFTLLMLGAGYWHKNHALVVPTAVRLQELDSATDWRFAVTLPEDSEVWLRLRADADAAGVASRVVNLGKLSLRQCGEAYGECAAVFHPSLLETFSATYVEAMLAGRPLVVSDRPFAHEICGDAALYFNPLDARAAADAIARLLRDNGLRDSLVKRGREKLCEYPDAAKKNDALCDLIEAFVARVSQMR